MKKLDRGHAPGQARFGPSVDVVPLYHRVYLLLLQNISDRSFPPDRPMPPETELSQALGVSRITLRRAMERLEREGMVYRRRGRGTFPIASQAPQSPSEASSLRDQVSLALKTKVRLLDHAIVPPGADDARLLELPSESAMLRIVRVRFDARSPISYSVCHVPGDLAQLLPRKRIGTLPISALLTTAGLALGKVGERLSACIADVAVSGLLGVDIGSPLLSLARTVRATDGRMVEHLRILFRPDRYEYRLDYAASKGDDASANWHAKFTELAS